MLADGWFLRGSAVLFGVGILVVQCHAADLKQGLAFYESSISGISGRYTIRVSADAGYQPQAGSAIMEGLQSEVRFIADLRAKRTRMDELRRWKYSWFSDDTEFVIRELRTCDGSRSDVLSFTFAESPVPVDVPRSVPMYLKVGSDSSIAANFGPWNFAGLRIHGFQQQSLARMVGNNVLRVAGRQDVDGHSCLVLSGDHQGKQWTVVVDPAIDYLPRQITWEASDSTARSSLTNTRFAQFDDASGNQRWFPTEGYAETFGWNYAWELNDLQLNPTITGSEFTIARDSLPPGVRISDGTSVTWSGNDRQRFEELKSLTDRSDQLMEERFHLVHGPVSRKQQLPNTGLRIADHSHFQWPLIGVACMAIAIIAVVVKQYSRIH